MCFKKVSIFIFLLLFLTIFKPVAIGGQNQKISRGLKVFKNQLANINATFVFPDGFNEIKPAEIEGFPCNYALQLPDSEFEARFSTRSLKREWRKFDRGRGNGINPDSLYSKIALNQVKSMSSDDKYFSRPIPDDVLQEYKADLGRSYFFNLADSPQTNHYQYALLVVIQKKRCGNITVVCLSNERGPGFFKNLNKLKNSLRFNN